MSNTEIKIRIAEIILAVAEAVSKGVNRLRYHLNRVLNKVGERLDNCINARIESIGDSLIAQAHAENTKPFDKANKVSDLIAKLNEQRAAYLTDEEVKKASDKCQALMVKRRELLNRKRYF